MLHRAHCQAIPRYARQHSMRCNASHLLPPCSTTSGWRTDSAATGCRHKTSSRGVKRYRTVPTLNLAGVRLLDHVYVTAGLGQDDSAYAPSPSRSSREVEYRTGQSYDDWLRGRPRLSHRASDRPRHRAGVHPFRGAERPARRPQRSDACRVSLSIWERRVPRPGAAKQPTAGWPKRASRQP